MISIDLDKARTDVAMLREISRNVNSIAESLGETSEEHQTAWKGGAGSEFQALAERLQAQISAFGAETTDIADIISKVSAEFEAADSAIFRGGDAR